MTNKPEDDPDIILREHSFDGIQEFDQKLPNWWLFTFYIAIVFFLVGWVAYYNLPLQLRSDSEKIDAQMALIDAKKEAQMAEMVASLTDESLAGMSDDPDHVAAGKAVFDIKCAICHAPDLTGQVNGVNLPGVSLVDAEWLHGGNPLSIMNTVTNGAPDPKKGMIAWKDQLTPPVIAQVVAYVLSQQPKQ